MTTTASLLLAAAVAQGLSAPPTVYHFYVAPNGLDSAAGNKAAPFKTIARAAAAALPGTTIHVAPGTYPGGFKTSASGTASARIYFISSERRGARIVPPENSRNPVAWDNRGSYVDIAGFEIDGSDYAGGAKWTTGLYSGGSYGAIRDNHVHHIAADGSCGGSSATGIGVDSYYRGVHSQVSANRVHDIGPPGCRSMYGIYINTPGSVTNNVVYRIADAAIHLWHDAHHVIVANNTVAASTTGIVVGGGDFYYTKGPNDHTHVHNNIVVDNRNGIVEQGSTGRNNSYRNNLVHQNTAASWRLRNGLTPTDSIDAPPHFVAYSRTGTPDFRLAGNSPAVGKGAATHAPPVDISGNARSAGTGFDIGAYQHQPRPKLIANTNTNANANANAKTGAKMAARMAAKTSARAD